MPIKKQLGIDEFKDVHVKDRSWCEIRIKFAEILAELEQISSTTENVQGIMLLKQKCTMEVKHALERQLAAMSFF